MPATPDIDHRIEAFGPHADTLCTEQADLPALPVLFEDAHYIAIDKPSGLLVHRSSIARDADEFALQRVRDQIGQNVFAVHRLDRATSGVLLFAKSSDAAGRASAIWQSEQVEKRYLAFVRGWTDDEQQIDYALKPRAAFKSQKEKAARREAQMAITRLETLARVEIDAAVGRYPSARYSLVALYPRTGRKHQLRRHMKHIFHHMLGDTTYGDGAHNRFIRDRYGLDRLMLMLQSLRFAHPYRQETVQIHCAADAAFRNLANGFGCLNALER